MKRRWIVAVVVLVVLIAILGVGLTADGDDPLEGRPTATETATPTATATATPTATRTATPSPSSEATKEHGGIRITVWQPTTAERLVFPNETRAPAEGNVFLLVRIDVKNVGYDGVGEGVSEPSYFEIVHGDSKYDVITGSSTEGPDAIESPSMELYEGDGVIFRGVESGGWVYAEIPANADRVEFTWDYRGHVADDRVLRWQLDVDGDR